MIKFRLKSMNRNTKYSLEAWPCPPKPNHRGWSQIIFTKNR